MTVVGLGPAGPELLGTEAHGLLEHGTHVFLRTARHPAAAAFVREGVRTFDALYESADSFDEIYSEIVAELVAMAERTAPASVVYAVPGSPLVAERSVQLLRADGRVEVTIVPGLSFLDLAWAALGIDPLEAGVRLVDAAGFGPSASEPGPYLVAQCWSRHLLSEVKLAWPDEVAPPRPVLLYHLGLDDERVTAVDWWDLDRTMEPDHLTSVYVPAVEPPLGVAADEIARLLALMDTLRERCPWDRAQTHASLMPHLVEECYEVLDALEEVGENGVPAVPTAAEGSAYPHLEEELGDLLFQIVFHARLASEAGRFDFADVTRGVHDKLVRRHPHVFGDAEVDGADQVVTNWETIKKSEKGRKSVTEGIPSALPALMLASKLVRKARSVGIEPDRTTGPDVKSAWDVLVSAASDGDPDADDPLATGAGELNQSVGELLFVVAQLAQRAGVDAELALRARVLSLRAEIRAAEGVPDQEIPNR